jgi:hypothetical protein
MLIAFFTRTLPRQGSYRSLERGDGASHAVVVEGVGRVGPLVNLPEFSTAFACPVGTPMNPETRCEIW